MAVLAALVLVPAPAAFAQDDASGLAEIQQLVAAGQTQRAEEIARARHNKVVARFGAQSIEAANAKKPLAFALFNLGGFDEAVEMLEARLAITEAVLGADTEATGRAASDLTSALIDLSSYLESNGDYRGAEPIRQKIVQYYTRYRGVEDIETLEYRRMLAVNLKLQNRAFEAEPIMKRTLELMEQHLGERNAATLTGYNDYGRILEALYEHKEAES
jgi:tetratricopeptide (TPR) repeat protein